MSVMIRKFMTGDKAFLSKLILLTSRILFLTVVFQHRRDCKNNKNNIAKKFINKKNSDNNNITYLLSYDNWDTWIECFHDISERKKTRFRIKCNLF